MVSCFNMHKNSYNLKIIFDVLFWYWLVQCLVYLIIECSIVWFIVIISNHYVVSFSWRLFLKSLKQLAFRGCKAWKCVKVMWSCLTQVVVFVWLFPRLHVNHVCQRSQWNWKMSPITDFMKNDIFWIKKSHVHASFCIAIHVLVCNFWCSHLSSFCPQICKTWAKNLSLCLWNNLHLTIA
jgi:hypothetical protein